MPHLFSWWIDIDFDFC
jgi:hypothetical protein